MDLETQNLRSSQNPELDSPDHAVEALRDRLHAQIARSRLSDEEKKESLDWLQSDPKSFDVKTLQTWLDQLPKSEAFREQTIKAYEQKFDRAAGQNLVAKNRKKAYMDWAKGLATGDLMKYLLKDDLDRPERVEVLEDFRRLPAAVRKEIQTAFDGSGLEERQKLITVSKKKHEELKAVFLKLPEETQKNYRTQFKALGLRDREILLSSIRSLKPTEGNDGNETVQRQKLLTEFEKQHAEAVRQNLFSPLSIPPNIAWAESLPIERLRTVAHGKKSDLHLRWDDRVKTRDAFYDETKISAEKRKPWELQFRNSDLDKRKEILAALLQKKPGRQEGKISYPENVMRRVLESEFRDPTLLHLRLLFTLAEKTKTLRRRAELRLEATHAEDLAEKADERGNKVDDGDDFNLENLEHHGEDRFALKRFHVGKLADGENAVANNMRLLDRNRREVSSDEFKRVIVDHLKSELVAALLARAAPKLPNANIADMRKVAGKLDPTVDLTKIAA